MQCKIITLDEADTDNRKYRNAAYSIFMDKLPRSLGLSLIFPDDQKALFDQIYDTHRLDLQILQLQMLELASEYEKSVRFRTFTIRLGEMHVDRSIGSSLRDLFNSNKENEFFDFLDPQTGKLIKSFTQDEIKYFIVCINDIISNRFKSLGETIFFINKALSLNDLQSFDYKSILDQQKNNTINKYSHILVKTT